MFYILHRFYVMSWTIVVAAAVIWAYPRTGISEPLLDWFEVWQNAQGAQTRPVALLNGQVVKVLDATSFTLRGGDRQFYSISLAGLVLPAGKGKAGKADPELADRGKARLRELVLSNEVQVTVAMLDPQRRGVGIARVGSTNVNAVMVESGVVRLKREFVKGLPLLEQYALIRADRRSQHHPTEQSPEPRAE